MGQWQLTHIFGMPWAHIGDNKIDVKCHDVTFPLEFAFLNAITFLNDMPMRAFLTAFERKIRAETA
jgi:hypothetical protein